LVAWIGKLVHFQNWGAALFTIFVKGAGFLPAILHARRKDGSELSGGDSEWRLRKPAPLNSARVRHPIASALKSGAARQRMMRVKNIATRYG